MHHNERQQHPLLAYSVAERSDYLSLVASMAAADGRISDAEITQIRTFCQTIELDDFGVGQVIAAVENPAGLDVPAILTRLAQTDLKFTVLTDLLCMAYADGSMCPSERKEIKNMAAWLHIQPPQLEAINLYIETLMATSTEKRTDADWVQRGQECAATLAHAGVPIQTVSIAGAITGERYSPALTALGMGLGITPCPGVVLPPRARTSGGVWRRIQKLIGGQT